MNQKISNKTFKNEKSKHYFESDKNEKIFLQKLTI